MGLCSSCFKGTTAEESVIQPSIEVRRRLQQEAAEKRQLENERRGVKDPDKVRRLQDRAAQMERAEAESARAGNDVTLRWQTN